jgi:TolB-like protein
MPMPLIVAFLLAAPAGGVAAPEARPTVVIAPLKAIEVSPGTAEVLTTELRTQVTRQARFHVVAPEEMAAIDDELQRQLSGGCDSASCVAELGGALGAQFLITGSIGKLGETYSLNLKLIDIEKVTTAGAVSGHAAAPDRFLPLMKGLVAELVGRPAPPAKKAKKQVSAKPQTRIRHELGLGLGSPLGGGVTYVYRPFRWVQFELDAGRYGVIGVRQRVYGDLETGFALSAVGKVAVEYGTANSASGLALSGQYKRVAVNGLLYTVRMGAGPTYGIDEAGKPMVWDLLLNVAKFW